MQLQLEVPVVQELHVVDQEQGLVHGEQQEQEEQLPAKGEGLQGGAGQVAEQGLGCGEQRGMRGFAAQLPDAERLQLQALLDEALHATAEAMRTEQARDALLLVGEAGPAGTACQNARSACSCSMLQFTWSMHETPACCIASMHVCLHAFFIRRPSHRCTPALVCLQKGSMLLCSIHCRLLWWIVVSCGAGHISRVLLGSTDV